MASENKVADHGIPTVTLAKLYEKQGLFEEAAAIYRELIRVHPGREDLMVALKNVEGHHKGRTPGLKQGLQKDETKEALEQLEKWRHAIYVRKRASGSKGIKAMRALVVHVSDADISDPLKRGDRSGEVAVEKLESCMKSAAAELDMVTEFFCAVNEEALTRKLQEAQGIYDVLIIGTEPSIPGNPQTRDALAALDIPIIEVHLSNDLSREPSDKSGIADMTTAHLAGFGEEGYAMAVQEASRMARQHFEAKAHAARHDTQDVTGDGEEVAFRKLINTDSCK